MLVFTAIEGVVSRLSRSYSSPKRTKVYKLEIHSFLSLRDGYDLGCSGVC